MGINIQPNNESVSVDNGRFIGGGARDQELDGDTWRRDSDLDRFGSSDRRNTLRHMSLLDCIEYEMSSRGGPCPPYIV